MAEQKGGKKEEKGLELSFWTEANWDDFADWKAANCRQVERWKRKSGTIY